MPLNTSSARPIKALIAIACIAAVVPTWAQNSRPAGTDFYYGQEVVANEVLLKFKPGHETARKAIEKTNAIDHSERIGDGTVWRMHSRVVNTELLVRDLNQSADLTYVEPNYIVHIDLTPNDPNFSVLWGMLNTGQSIVGVTGLAGADIKAPQAWDIGTGNRNNVVAVVDTGIDYNHPDLAANIWTCPQDTQMVIAGATVTCPAGAHGYNAITHTFDPLDDNNHGSHCSGTIGGVGNNGIGVAGVSWTASIMGCKFLGSGGSGSISDAVNAVEFAIQAKLTLGAQANVRVLSNSWGGGGFLQAFLDEMTKANTNNILFVCAAGNNSSNNDTTTFYPASYQTINEIVCAATDNLDHMASFSNYGANTVHLGAPGVNVYSSIRGGGYAYFSGTSMATPHVAGAANLMLSVNPTLTVAQIKAAILGTVDPISALSGRTTTGGRLNLFRAVSAIVPTGDFSITGNPVVVTVPRGSFVNGYVSVFGMQGFSGSVTLSASGLPGAVTAEFGTPVIVGSGATPLKLTVGSLATPGNYSLTITGTSGSLVHNGTIILKIV